jgi:SAM-dependent methyltransferase
VSRQCDAVIEETRATIRKELQQIRRWRNAPLDVLDIGCWDGTTTEAYRAILGGSARGVEIFPEQMQLARSKGIDVAAADLENDELPWADASVDVVVANQVFEHLKNIWLPLSEIGRVLKPGGHLVFSVPNLGSVHNRVMLALGLQPSSIRTFGPHVRGFAYRQLRELLEFKSFLAIRRAVGVGFYPIPAQWTRWLARAWVGGSHTPVIVAERVAPAGTSPPWRELASSTDVGAQTYYAPKTTSVRR